MLVLTFPDRCRIVDGKISARILNRFLVSFRRRYPGVEYWWVREFQGNGQPHYHVMSNVPEERIDRLWFGRWWAQAVMAKSPDDWQMHKSLAEDIIKVHKHPKQWQALRSKDGATRYLLSYLTKEYQKTAPENFINVGRWWGCSRGLKKDSMPTEQWPIDESTLRVVLRSWGLSWVASWEYLPKYIHVPLTGK